jgi:lipopolysaccharide export system protein LptA
MFRLHISGIIVLNTIIRSVFCFIFVLCNSHIIAQPDAGKQIEIINANSIEFNKKSGTNAKKLIGDVQFKHGDAVMFCDSAYFYSDKNQIDAFGNISIHQGDTLHLYGEELNYDGNSKVAQIRKKVKLIDKETVLTTNYLDFKVAEDIGYYMNGGNIVNNENNLSSEIGYYYAHEKLFYYRGKVVIVNPKYVIKSDTLKYNTVSRTAYFFGPTNITSKDNFIYCENGWYNTATNISQFNKNAYLTGDKRLLKGDSLYYDRNLGSGKAFNHIWLIDSAQNIILTGNKAKYHEYPEFAMISDSAVFMQFNDKDTLFMHADTLLSETDTTKNSKTVRCFNHVRIFKTDLQGQCDSLTYTTEDSTMRLFKLPILWSDENQITAEYIEMLLSGKKISQTNINGSSFIVWMEDTGKFNQIKGKRMVGYFKNNELYKVFVNGNGQTIYYAKDNNTMIGINKAVCSDLVVYLENRKPQKIVFLKQPDATLYPLNKIPAEELFLRDFKWYEKSRPRDKNQIFNWVKE